MSEVDNMLTYGRIFKMKKLLLNFTQSDVSVLNKKCCYKGFFKMEEYQVSHALFNGKQSRPITREIFDRGNAVVVITYDAKNYKVVLLEQFRVGAIDHGDTPWLIEFDAGMFEPNESPVEVAVREAKEAAKRKAIAERRKILSEGGVKGFVEEVPKEDRLEKALTALGIQKARDSGKIALMTARKMLNRIVQNPKDPKYRSVNIENETIRRKVTSKPGGVNLLLASGFVKLDGKFVMEDANVRLDSSCSWFSMT